MKTFCSSLIIALFSFIASAQGVDMQLIFTKTGASFRGLSVIDDHVAWVSGSEGWVGKSLNGGNDWTFAQVKGFEKCDFRSLYAFDEKNAVIANAGSPAYILRTSDGGHTWKVVYENSDSAAFFDGIDFWNSKKGIIYGDPIKGRMMLLKTKDGGRTWKDMPEKSRPKMSEGEASFAASGTNIRCYGKRKAMIATGGSVARLLISRNRGSTWSTFYSYIPRSSTSGIYSFAFLNSRTGIVVSGDYKKDSVLGIVGTSDGGKMWTYGVILQQRYRECVVYISKKLVLVTGPSGTDISHDGGSFWEPFGNGFHVVRKSRKGNLILFAGAEGKLSLITL